MERATVLLFPPAPLQTLQSQEESSCTIVCVTHTALDSGEGASEMIAGDIRFSTEFDLPVKGNDPFSILKIKMSIWISTAAVHCAVRGPPKIRVWHKLYCNVSVLVEFASSSV